jgi:hypothetical protein
MTKLLTYDAVPILPRVQVWPGFLSEAETSLFVAAGGTGKGVALAKVVAIITTGDPFPGQPASARRDPKTVIVLAPEDDRHKDMRGRLDAAGADVRYVVDATYNEDDIPRTFADFPELTRLVADINDPDNEEYAHLPEVGLIVLDPLMKLIKSDVSVATRRGATAVTLWLETFARACNCPVAVTHHTNWDGGVNGSRGLLDGLRNVYRIDIDKADPEIRVITNIKTNTSAGGQGIKYRITEAGNGYPVAEFIEAGEAMQRRIEASKARLALMAGIAPEPVPGPLCRAIVAIDRPGEPAERLTLGDAEGIKGAQRLAQGHPLAGLKLVWVARDAGMHTAVRVLPGGGTAKYAAYELTGRAASVAP